MSTPTIEQIQRHWSVRAYKPDPVPDELVEQIVAAGSSTAPRSPRAGTKHLIERGPLR